VLFDFDNDNEAKAEIAALSDWIGFARIDLDRSGLAANSLSFLAGHYQIRTRQHRLTVRFWPDPDAPTAGPAGPLTEVELPCGRSE